MPMLRPDSPPPTAEHTPDDAPPNPTQITQVIARPAQIQPPDSLPPAPPPTQTPPPPHDPDDPLTVPQRIALESIAHGSSIKAAAKSAGVKRQTVHRWIKSDPDFAAAYNAWEREALDSAHARALAITDAAFDVIDAAIRNGNLNAALHVVKAAGALAPRPTGPSDPATLRRREDIRRTRQDAKLERAEKKLGLRPREPAPPQSSAEVDALIGPLADARDALILHEEQLWRLHLLTKDLTPDQCAACDLPNPPGPPAVPRPSPAEFRAAQERYCKRRNLHVESNIEYELTKYNQTQAKVAQILAAAAAEPPPISHARSATAPPAVAPQAPPRPPTDDHPLHPDDLALPGESYLEDLR